MKQILLIFIAAAAVISAVAETKPYPFYIMDTTFAPPFKRDLPLKDGLALVKRLGYDGLGKRHTDGDKTPRPTKRDVNNLFIAPKIPAGLEMLQRVDATIANGMTREEACDKHGISLMFYERLETMFRPK